MEKKKKLNNWQPRYPVVDAEEEGLNNWFKDNPYVTGMAIGAGSNGITGPRRIVHNPYSKIIPWKWDPRWKGLDKIETVRHDMDEMNYKPNFQLFPEQRILQNTPLEKGGVKGTPYETDDNAFKQSIMSRIIAGDTINLRITPEQINEYKIYFKNKYSNGGELSDEQYYNIMRKVAEENNPKWNEYRTKEGEKQLSVEQDYTRLLNSNDYDYRGYYNKYPESAANANTHWPDEFKTAWHPTFSIESRYSGVKNSKYNPLGLPGGFWSGDIFIPRAWQFLENKDYYKPKYQLGGFLNFLKNSIQIRTGKTLVKGVREGIKGVKRLVKRPKSNTLFTANYKDGSFLQRDLGWLKQYFAKEKIKGNNYGITDGDIQQGLPNHVLTYLNQNTVERNARAMRKNGYSDREILMYKDKVNEEMRNVRVGKYSDKDYKDAGYDDFGGFYDNNNNFISINMEGAFDPDYVMKHEGRHLIDYRTDMTDDLRGYIEKAYDNDFLNLPKYDETGKLKGYKHMDRERVTTNRDARDWFLNNLSSVDLLNPNELHKYPFWNKLDMLSFQDQLIDLANDDKIILAVEEANGYGSKYIKYLRKNNKLTPQKILQFRDAMKNVGSYMIPVTTGLTLYNNK